MTERDALVARLRKEAIAEDGENPWPEDFAGGDFSRACADVIERLERERDEARADCDLLTHKIITCGVAASHPDSSLSRREKDYGGKWDSPQAEQVRQLRAECEALRKDAERYRWLRRNQCWPDRELDRLRDEGSNGTNAELLDAAIDAARAAISDG